MKFRFLFALTVLLAGGGLFSLPAAAQNGQLILADYGIRSNRIDVTDRIRALMQNGSLNFEVTNDMLGMGDPVPGVVKELRLFVRDSNGRVRDYEFRERSFANIQLDANQEICPQMMPGLQILQAVYGLGGRTIDVASRLQGMVRDDKLNVRVDNETMGSDPSHDTRKELYVLYVYQGRRKSVIIPEKSELRIP